MAELTRDPDIVNVLERARVVAVLGAHREPHRPAFYVPDYLHQQGYRVLPVNPQLVGETLWGEPVRAHLTDLTEPVDLVDVFRRPDALDAHLDDFLAMRPGPGAIWFQLGIRNDRVAAALVARGFDVVQDRCTLADHKRFRRSGLLPARTAKPG
ncbi:MAG TPA: CoA-binding protein [Kofleriaceae bacterium]|nr:CoA-binding protein [Kofleriaceae bacterium]